MSDRISSCVFCCTGADGASEIHPFDDVPLSVLYPAIVWEALDAGEYKTGGSDHRAGGCEDSLQQQKSGHR